MFLIIIDGSLRLRVIVRIKDSVKFIKHKYLITIIRGRVINVAVLGPYDIALGDYMDVFRFGDYLVALPCFIQG